MNAKTIVSSFPLLALCFVPAASFAKAITPDYSCTSGGKCWETQKQANKRKSSGVATEYSCTSDGKCWETPEQHHEKISSGVATPSPATDRVLYDLQTGKKSSATGLVRYDGSQMVTREFDDSAWKMNIGVKNHVDNKQFETGRVTILDKNGKPISKNDVLSLQRGGQALLNVGCVVAEVKHTQGMSGAALENAQINASKEAVVLAGQLSEYRRTWMNTESEGYDRNGYMDKRTLRYDEKRDAIPSYVAQQHPSGNKSIWRMEPIYSEDMVAAKRIRNNEATPKDKWLFQRKLSAADITNDGSSFGNVKFGFVPIDLAVDDLYFDENSPANKEMEAQLAKIKKIANPFFVEPFGPPPTNVNELLKRCLGEGPNDSEIIERCLRDNPNDSKFKIERYLGDSSKE